MTNEQSNEQSDEPVVVTTAASEPLASIMVAQLRAEGIQAEMSGEYTSGFRAEAPGRVQILVHASDEARAGRCLRKSQATRLEVSRVSANVVLHPGKPGQSDRPRKQGVPAGVSTPVPTFWCNDPGRRSQTRFARAWMSEGAM